MSLVDRTHLSVSKIKRAMLIVKLIFLSSLIGILSNLYFYQKEKETTYLKECLGDCLYFFQHGQFKLLADYIHQENAKNGEYFLAEWKDRSITGFLYSLPFSLAIILVFGGLSENGIFKNKDHLRGSKLAKRAPFFYKKEPYKIGGIVAYPKSIHKQHTLISGTTGAGKSQAIAHLLRSIRKTDDIVIIYDKADLLANFYQDGDSIFNPFDARTVKIDPLASISNRLEAKQLANQIIDSGKNLSSSSEFFTEGSRAILTEIFVIAANRNLTLKKAIQLYKSLNIDQLKDFLSETEANKYVGQENFGDLLSTINNKITALDYLHDDADFELETYIKNGTGWLFLTAQEKQMSVSGPIIKLIIEQVAEILLSSEKSGRTVWFVLDEFSSLPKLDSIVRVMAQGRKYGAAVVLGLQEIAQVEQTYGEAGAREVIGLCSTKLILRAEDVKTAKFLSDSIGNAELVESSISESASCNNNGVGSVSKSEKSKTENIVLYGEIQNLKNLHCYIKTVGLPVIGPINIKFKKFEDEKIEQFVLDQSALRSIRKSPTVVPTVVAADDADNFWS